MILSPIQRRNGPAHCRPHLPSGVPGVTVTLLDALQQLDPLLTSTNPGIGGSTPKPLPKKPSISPLLSSPHRRLVSKVFSESAPSAVPDVPFCGEPAAQDAPWSLLQSNFSDSSKHIKLKWSPETILTPTIVKPSK